MKIASHALAAVALFMSLGNLAAQDARYFRVVGPVRTTIASITADGSITWTNTPTNATFTVQTTASLSPIVAWTDWTRVLVTSTTTSLQVFSLNPPAGMVLIPAGTFTMGDNLDGTAAALPLHSVSVSAFYLDRFETTKTLWDQVYQWATNHGYGFALGVTPGAKGTNHPMHSVDWYNRIKWCNARSEMEGLSPCYFTSPGQTNVFRTGTLVLSNACVKWTANGYRLPTEAEWERAARAGAAGRRFPWGNTISHSQANYLAAPTSYTYDVSPTPGYNPLFDVNPTPYTNPVGYFAPNAYGLYDMAGNVWEWCWDSYDVYSATTQVDPRGPSIGAVAGGIPIARVLRGGAWGVNATFSRCADRISSTPSNAVNNVGSRCVRAF